MPVEKLTSLIFLLTPWHTILVKETEGHKRGAHDRVAQYKDHKFEAVDWKAAQGKSHARFFYTATGELALYYEANPTPRGYFRYGHYRDHFWEFNEFTAEVICQPKWKGDGFKGSQPRKTPDRWNADPVYVSDKDVIKSKGKRAITIATNQSKYESTPLEQGCRSIAGHLVEIAERSDTRLRGLLALVDIRIDSGRSSHSKRDHQDGFNDTVALQMIICMKAST